MKNNLWIGLIILASTQAIAGGGSAVGNGGDIVSRFLAATRDAAKQVILQLQHNPKEITTLCDEQTNLTLEQREQCRNFIKGSLKELLALSAPQSSVNLELRSDPLLAPGDDGQMRQVDARTLLGPDGPIEFYYQSVQNFSPLQLLTVMFHEFGHKIPYRNADDFIEDNSSYGAFKTGRAFLDSSAYALASYAERGRIIGSTFLLNDRFVCQVSVGPGNHPMGIEGFSPRMFLNKEHFDAFETSIGSRPTDLVVFVDEYGKSRIYLRALFHEENGCRSEQRAGSKTKLELVRVFLNDRGQPTGEEQVLVSHERSAFNPVCDDDQAFDISYGSLSFNCRYTGSFGQTSY